MVKNAQGKRRYRLYFGRTREGVIKKAKIEESAKNAFISLPITMAQLWAGWVQTMS